MDLKEIKRLITMVEEAQISHLSVEMDGMKIEVKKEFSAPSPVMMAPPPQSYSVTLPQSSGSAPVLESEDTSHLLEVKSQMVGTFYSRPNPESAPFVKVGDTISVGQVVCVLEAMKLFNEIESDVSGHIEKVCVSDGEAVEFGQVLFLVKP